MVAPYFTIPRSLAEQGFFSLYLSLNDRCIGRVVFGVTVPWEKEKWHRNYGEWFPPQDVEMEFCKSYTLILKSLSVRIYEMEVWNEECAEDDPVGLEELDRFKNTI
jgi:hypothetical protein